MSLALPQDTYTSADQPTLAVEDLRACLQDCQVNRGLDPLFCQESCQHLTPGDVGACTTLFGCFVQDFSLPSAPEVGSALGAVTAPVERLLVLAIIAGAVLLGIRHF